MSLKRQRDADTAYDEMVQREIDDVDAAFRDILAGNFESGAVNEVMKRRAGSLADYYEATELLSAAVRAKRASGG